jgi:2-oxo-4-hydroxy-4-carboxy-5-ureidoimidazoline decarboxylase
MSESRDQSPVPLEQFNALLRPEAAEILRACCGSRRWVESVLARRPYVAFDDLLIAADEAFATLERDDWVEAFAAHASDDHELAEPGEAYAQKFGYPFVAHDSAGGSSFELLSRRLENDPDTELPAAATEQMKITNIRLHQLIRPTESL